MIKLGFWEFLLIEILLFIGIWLWDDYLGTMVSIIWSGICFLILAVSLIVELIERSRVPKSYYLFMVASVLAPLFAAGVYYAIVGQLEWTKI